MTDSELIKIAKDMQEFSYSPYSAYRVGVALLSKSGKVYGGCNIENISFSATVCAERVAFLKAVSEGESKFSKMALSASDNEICVPCGVCLQFMSEFIQEDFEIISVNNKSEIQRFNFIQLFPYAFKTDGVIRRDKNE